MAEAVSDGTICGAVRGNPLTKKRGKEIQNEIKRRIYDTRSRR